MNTLQSNEMARQLGIAPRTLRAYCKAGVIPCYKLPGKTFSNGHHNINRGMVLFNPEQVFNALAKFAVNQPTQKKRRAGRITAVPTLGD